VAKRASQFPGRRQRVESRSTLFGAIQPSQEIGFVHGAARLTAQARQPISGFATN